MTGGVEPLALKATFDFDSAVTVTRTSDNHYQVSTPDGRVHLEDEEIGRLAELAGFEVSER